MTEIMVLERLAQDDVFPWYREPEKIEPLELCFIMRRHPSFRYQFANTVGKRLLSERLISTSRSQIIEHHRSANWAEREYRALFAIMKERRSEFDLMVTFFPECPCPAAQYPLAVGDISSLQVKKHKHLQSLEKRPIDKMEHHEIEDEARTYDYAKLPTTNYQRTEAELAKRALYAGKFTFPGPQAWETFANEQKKRMQEQKDNATIVRMARP